MKARMPAGFGRPDMNALMRQAQKMQDDMKAKQADRLAGTKVTIPAEAMALAISPKSSAPLVPDP